MLIEFSVGNYKSFRDRVTFSMIAANIKSAHPNLDESNTILVNDKMRLLTSAAIYGKNASGKSNFGKALDFMRGCVLSSASMPQEPVDIDVQPFLLSTRTREESSEFEIVFLIQNKQYRYGFKINTERVISEWLYHVATVRETLLFERDEQEISVKSGFKEGRGLEERTRPNALFLSVVVQFNGKIATKIADWFMTLNVTTGLQDQDFQFYTAGRLKLKERDNSIIALVKSFDLDIHDLFTTEPPSPDTLPQILTEAQKQRIIEEAKDRIWVVHPVRDEEGKPVDTKVFDLNNEESQGTRKMVAMAGPIASILLHGNILFIDEFDARLHTELAQRIVGLFNSKETNPNGAQLIFVTHDTHFLDPAIMRRDQIWFADKDAYEVTRLVSLAEYGERNNADWERRYLGGRYGGVPSFNDILFTPETVK